MNNKYHIAFLLIFFVSGFSGLIYESIWTQYLRLFLGHAAYAQTLVLVIFMGGMAIGSYSASRFSLKWKNLFTVYASLELIIGFLALIFHESFSSFLELSYDSILTKLETPISVNLYKWLSSALLILPQSILLGTTFPLMSAAILRSFPTSPGKNISLLYFTNSIGAAIGVLVSGFYLINAFGLQGTIRIAGILNIIIALTVLYLLRKSRVKFQIPAKPSKEQSNKKNPISKIAIILLSVSVFTGMASFIYEIGWIRMLNLVLGTSTHAFELMLSAFIFGLAFGGFWIRKRIDRMSNPILSLGYIQIIMGVMALLTLLFYSNTFNLMQWIMEVANKDAQGYLIFNLSSNGIALLIMFPVTFCAGMTLPIITTILFGLRGERSIGLVYGWNTIGAIIGVLFAVHIGLPILGLKGLISFGAGIDIVLGILLLFVYSQKSTKFDRKILIASIGVIALLYVVSFVNLDIYKMASGVYRGNELLSSEDVEIIYHRDGKTASATTMFHPQPGILSISTNGKSDASIFVKKQMTGTMDDFTMVQIGMIPMALNPNAQNVGIIGLGAGITTKSVLKNPKIQSVHTIEIEKEIVNAAKHLGPKVVSIFTDLRSKIIIDDAKSYFASDKFKYDIIISEPSNPWVSGVSNLFTLEFYAQIKQYLNEDGIFAQWLQLYEIDLELVVSVLKAVSLNFDDYGIYILDHNNCLIVAKKDGALPALDGDIIKISAIAESLKHVKVNNLQDIEFRFLGNKEIIDPFLDGYPIPANSDYYPVLDQNAARSRFLDKKATDIYSFTHYLHPVVSLLCNRKLENEPTSITTNPYYTLTFKANEAIALRDYFLYDNFDLHYKQLPENLRQEARITKNIFQNTTVNSPQLNRVGMLFNTSSRTSPYLTSIEMKQIWESLGIINNESTLSTEEQLWASLFLAIAERDAETMILKGEFILENYKNMPVNAYDYLVSAVIIGCIKKEHTDKAQIVWHRYKNQLSDDSRSKMLFILLYANSK